MNRVKLGDECTKFFHAMATISFRRNKISQILNDSGAWIQDHDGKVGLLWNSFKNRTGVSQTTTMHFDLQSLITPRTSLQPLVEPFEIEEINSIVKKMPTDKAPRPDGFNGMFVKKCWQFIKDDFYSLCDFFYKLDVHFGVSTTPSSPWSLKLIPQIYE